jgi:hypothetical protein
MNHAFGRGFEDSIREAFVTGCPRQNHRARHASKGRGDFRNEYQT